MAPFAKRIYLRIHEWEDNHFFKRMNVMLQAANMIECGMSKTKLINGAEAKNKCKLARVDGHRLNIS